MGSNNKLSVPTSGAHKINTFMRFHWRLKQFFLQLQSVYNIITSVEYIDQDHKKCNANFYLIKE